jgi:hypothetical protein
MLEAVTSPKPRSTVIPLGAAALTLAFAAVLYFGLSHYRTGVAVHIDAPAEQSEIRLTGATWNLPDVAVETLRISQALGTDVEVDVPIAAERCAELGRDLGVDAEQQRACASNGGMLHLSTPLTVSWTKPALLSLADQANEAATIDVLPVTDSTGPALRIDVDGATTRPRWCFSAQPLATMTVDAPGGQHTDFVASGGATVGCDDGVRMIIAGPTAAQAAPAMTLSNLARFRLDAEAEELTVTNFAGELGFGTVGAVTVDHPGPLRVVPASGRLDTSVVLDDDGVRLTVDGRNVKTALAEHGVNQVPSWWTRGRSVTVPIVTALLTAVVASLVVLINILTERISGPRTTRRGSDDNVALPNSDRQGTPFPPA